MDPPRFRYEIQNGVVDPEKDMYPGAGHEWFSVQHWVSVEQDDASGTVMPLDALLLTLGDIYRGAWPKQFGVRPGTIFSYAMNNYWSTNYDGAQGGHTCLRYVVTSAASTDAIALSRMGWEEATPLEIDEVTMQDKAQSPAHDSQAQQAGYLKVNDTSLLVEDWKLAEDGNGMILRFLDLWAARNARLKCRSSGAILRMRSGPTQWSATSRSCSYRENMVSSSPFILMRLSRCGWWVRLVENEMNKQSPGANGRRSLLRCSR